MKKVRKGFTVVELVIVIAVIAIIAAIMIPFLNNNNSTVSADTDTQLIRNLNAALAFDSAQLGDKKHTNMSQVLDVVEKSGYIVEDINESEETYEIIWDSSNDVFCYLILTSNGYMVLTIYFSNFPETHPDSPHIHNCFWKHEHSNNSVFVCK